MYAPRSVTLTGSLHAAPNGVDHVLDTVSRMRRLVQEYYLHPSVIAASRSLISLIPEKDDYAEARALFHFVRDTVRYVADPVDVEMITSPDKILDTLAGDCDDKVILLAALLQSIGIRTRFVVAGYDQPGAFEHVYLVANMRDGAEVALDPTESEAFGWEPPAPLCKAIEAG